MKKLKSLLLTLAMLLCCITVSAEEVEIGGLWYNLITKASIAEVVAPTDGTKYSGDIVIPENVTYESETFSVTSIGNYAFVGCRSLTTVTVPNSVTSIGNYTFSNCTSLTTVTIPKSVTSIGNAVFDGCTSLNSITIPNSVKNIGNYAFKNCSSLTSITIPNNVTSIGSSVFYGCTSLTSITIPNSVTSIGEAAFYGCSSLATIAIPNSVTTIGKGSFEECSELTSITIPNSVTSIGGSAFYGCNSLTSITIPNSVTSIGSGAFSNCSKLSSITIPNSVTSIEGYAFSGCSGLTSVTIPNSITSINNGVFKDCSSLTSITIPNSVTDIGDYAFYYCSNLTSITIGNGVTNIGHSAFGNCIDLENVYCFAENTPLTGSDAFNNSYPEYATLHVPTTSISNYKTIVPWSNFGTISSIDENIAVLTAIVNNGGSIVLGEKGLSGGSTEYYITKNDIVLVNITADDGYALDKVTLDGTDITSQVTENGVLRFTLTEDAQLEVTFKFVATTATITLANDVATFCCNRDLDFTNAEGLKAYIASGFNKATKTVLLTRVYDVPANTGIILIGEAGTYQVDYSTSTSWYTNILKGVTEATTISPTNGEYTNYVLANGTNGIGFYPLSQSGTLAAGKAYLQLPTSASSAKGFSMSFEDETTGISDNYEIEIMNSDAAVYDMQGRKVKNPTKGLYIVNGKKVVIK